MINRPALLGLVTAFSITAFSQTELTIKKFRFQNHSAATFERLVLEFDGIDINEFPEVKMGEFKGQKEASISVRNVQLVGVIPENLINDSYKEHARGIGPLSISPDAPQNGFTVRTLIKKSDHQLDAFWLSHPNRLVIDVFSPYSNRASSRDVLGSGRDLASVKVAPSKVHSSTKPAAPEGSPVFCFPANAKMNAEVAFQPWRGLNGVPLAVKDPTAVESEMTEGIVCYPAQSRVYPNLTFTMTDRPMPAVEASDSKTKSPETAAPAQRQTSSLAAPASGSTGLLPSLSTQARVPASAAPAPTAAPRPQNGLPPSLGASFNRGSGVNPTSLLPPLR